MNRKRVIELQQYDAERKPPKKFAESLTDYIKKEVKQAQDTESRSDSYNITALVPPYFNDIHSRRVLEYALGVDNVQELEKTNASVYYGIVNAVCPARGQDAKMTEPFFDPIAGKIQCRYPTIKSVPGLDAKSYCPRADGDPFAIEAYVDSMNKVQCRRPVIRGSFSCAYGKKHVTMRDGTGICVDDVMMPKVAGTLVKMVNSGTNSYLRQIDAYANIFKTRELSQDSLKKLANLVKGHPEIATIFDKINDDPALIGLFNAVKASKYRYDSNALNSALKKHLEMLYRRQFNTVKDAHAYLNGRK